MTERSIVNAPGIGNERAYTIVQMCGCSDGIARIAYGTYLCMVIYESKALGLDFVQMRIVVQAPFRTKHHDKLTSLAIFGRKEHDANMQKSHKFAHYSMQYGISTWIFVLYSQLQETAISEMAVSQLQI